MMVYQAPSFLHGYPIMPRATAHSRLIPVPPPPLPEAQAASAFTGEQPASSKPKDRGPNGQFIKGNCGGPGNPHARHCARMLDLFRTAINDEDMVRLFRVLFNKAVKGDLSAAKIVLAYKIGKPRPCPDPDSNDRDEWDHYQHDAIEPQEMKLVLSSLPTRVGNDIARTALGIVTQARQESLASQLVEILPAAHKPTEESGVANQQAPEHAPIANGNLGPRNRTVHLTMHDQRSTIHDQESTIHDQRSTPTKRLRYQTANLTTRTALRERAENSP